MSESDTESDTETEKERERETENECMPGRTLDMGMWNNKLVVAHTSTLLVVPTPTYPCQLR